MEEDTLSLASIKTTLWPSKAKDQDVALKLQRFDSLGPLLSLSPQPCTSCSFPFSLSPVCPVASVSKNLIRNHQKKPKSIDKKSLETLFVLHSLSFTHLLFC